MDHKQALEIFVSLNTEMSPWHFCNGKTVNIIIKCYAIGVLVAKECFNTFAIT